MKASISLYGNIPTSDFWEHFSLENGNKASANKHIVTGLQTVIPKQ